MISIDDFKKVEIRAGKVLTAERIEGSEKLLKLTVDFAPTREAVGGPTESVGRDIRQVVSGIAKYISPEDLVGTLCAFVTNLEPRQIMGLESQAMIMAISSDLPGNATGNYFSLLKIDSAIPPGAMVK